MSGCSWWSFSLPVIILQNKHLSFIFQQKKTKKQRKWVWRFGEGLWCLHVFMWSKMLHSCGARVHLCLKLHYSCFYWFFLIRWKALFSFKWCWMYIIRWYYLCKKEYHDVNFVLWLYDIMYGYVISLRMN